MRWKELDMAGVGAMNITWFWVLGAMLTAYAVLDGYDLGVGAVSLWIAKGDDQRRMALNAIGPVWNGNEVWLLAAGGMMVVSFPRVYAAGFSGFYLALMVVLWLLILRGVSIEFRSQVKDPLWRALWDSGFWFGSLLLALLLGVALGNVVRGLPIGPDGYFQGTFALLLNPYSLLTGILSTVLLAWHGTNYLRVKTEGALFERAVRWSRALWWAVVVMVIVVTVATFLTLAGRPRTFLLHPAAWGAPLVMLIGLVWGFLSRREDRSNSAFRASTLVIVALMITAALTVFPNLLPSTLNPAYSLNIYNAASSPHALRVSLIANAVGMIGVIVYSTYVHRVFHGKVRLEEGHY
ncbi:MAG TPA: cytochrome d ubiquinol oxidase subunit II [Terriglobia bacterium]|nr:cytochrome d ubiquinol oxidase subunit II [Terriglobia bacterium]